jgi:hypothetical protein
MSRNERYLLLLVKMRTCDDLSFVDHQQIRGLTADKERHGAVSISNQYKRRLGDGLGDAGDCEYNRGEFATGSICSKLDGMLSKDESAWRR